MDREAVKNYLAIYDEMYSYRQFANITGYSIEELHELYDELVDNKELQKRRNAMRRMVVMDGVYRIDPVTFESIHYHQPSELKQEGYNVSNVFYSCRHPASICNGYMWRFGVDVNSSDIEGSLKRNNPELFVRVKSTSIKTGEETEYDTLQVANKMGFNKKGVMEVITGKKKSYKGCNWEVV